MKTARVLSPLAALALVAAVAACGNRDRLFDPAGPTAAPIDLTATAMSTTSIALSWDVPAGADHSGGVRIFRDGAFVGITADDGWVDRGLTPATTYSYRVTGIDSDGNDSPPSNPATATTLTLPSITVSVVPPNPSIGVGHTSQLAAVVREAGSGIVLQGRPIIWSSSNTQIATISANGLVTGVAPGTSVITATSDGVSGTTTVSVNTISIFSVTVTPPTSTVGPTQAQQLTATARDAAGNVLTGRLFSWASSDPSKATVSSTGLVTGVAAGSVTITATSEGVSGNASVTIASAPPPPPPPTTTVATVTVTPPTVSLAPGATQQLTAITRDANGNILTGRQVTWSSSNNSAATVSSSGLVTAVALGSATITATSEGASGTSAVSVVTSPPPPPAPVATVTVTPPTVSVQVGSTSQLTATVRDGAGNVLTGRSVFWASSNPAVATVSANGLVTGTGAGSATITATSEGVSGTASATITPVPVSSVGVSPASASIQVDGTHQFTATPKDAQGNALSGRVVTWASSNTSVATVSATGLVTGVAAGSATITATSEGVNGTASVTVTPKPIVSIEITPQGPLCVGGFLQLIATPKDAQGNPLTGRVIVWSTNNSAIATVSQSGLAAGISLGSVTITAESEGVSASVTISLCAPVVATVEVTPFNPTRSLLSGPLQLTATAKDAQGNVITGRPVTWGSSNGLLGSVSVGGLVSLLGLGQVTITATIDGVQGSTTITIVP